MKILTIMLILFNVLQANSQIVHSKKIEQVKKGVEKELKIFIKKTSVINTSLGFKLQPIISSSAAATSPGYGSPGAYLYSNLDSWVTLANGITVNYITPIHLAPYYNWERVGVRFANKKYSIYINWTYESGFYEIGPGTNHNSVNYCIKNYNRIKAALYWNQYNSPTASVSFWGSSSCSSGKIYY
jgi:hypothetical protein